jgi:hypothetical protein
LALQEEPLKPTRPGPVFLFEGTSLCALHAKRVTI